MANNDMIQAIRPRLRGLVAEGEALASMKHQGIKGRLREVLIQIMIEPFLPPSVKVLTGTIVAPNKQRVHRNQDDLVLFSLERAPLLSNYLEQAIMPIRGVLAQIEVKSTLTRSDIISAVNASIELTDLSVGVKPTNIVFAYRSDIAGNELERLFSVLNSLGIGPGSGQVPPPIHCIFVVDKGMWLFTKFKGQAGWWFVNSTEERHMLTFCSLISNTCYVSERNQDGVGEYLLEMDWIEGPISMHINSE